MTKSIRTVVDKLSRGGLVLLFSILVVDVLWQVVSRYALGAPSSFTGEVARFSFLWLAFLGAAQVASDRGHLAIDLLPEALDGAKAKGLRELIGFFSLSFAALLTVGGLQLVLTSFELGQSSPVLGIPLGVVYAIVPLSGVLVAFHLVTGRRAGGEEE